MQASAWAIVHESLLEMKRLGLQDKQVLFQLKNSERMRTLYLLTYDMVQKLLLTGQQRLRIIVQNTRMYTPYSSSKSRFYSFKQRISMSTSGSAVHRRTRIVWCNSIHPSFAMCTSRSWTRRLSNSVSLAPSSLLKLCSPA